MTTHLWIALAISVFYVALSLSAWVGRTVGPWFLVGLGFGALVLTVTYLVVGELRDRKPWTTKSWWIDRQVRP